MITKVFKYLFHPIKFIRIIRIRKLEKNGKKYSDEDYIKKQFFLKKGRKLRLNNPKTFAEKLQWLKLNYHNPLCTTLSDKISAKKYLSSIIDVKYIPKLLGVWDTFEEIDFSILPEKFVIKTNHDCGGNVICLNKKNFNFEDAKKKIKEHLNTNYFWHNREWPYKNIKPKVFVEEYLDSDEPLVDYKFYCFDGKPIYFMYSVGEYSHKSLNHKFNISCESIDHLFKKKPSLPLNSIKIPQNFDEMLGIVNKICSGFPHVRVDLYNINGNVYVGEMTFFTNGGYVNILDKKFDLYLGSLIPLKKYEED